MAVTNKSNTPKFDVITLIDLKTYLYYNEDTGFFEWIKKSGCKVKIGSKAGTLHPSGYIKITILGRKYLAHKLAWLYIHGYYSSKVIDHINGNKSDNRIENLRECTKNQNEWNRCTNKTNTSGMKNISMSKSTNKWHVQIKANGKKVYSKLFSSLDEAKIAAINAREKFHGEFANHG